MDGNRWGGFPYVVQRRNAGRRRNCRSWSNWEKLEGGLETRWFQPKGLENWKLSSKVRTGFSRLVTGCISVVKNQGSPNDIYTYSVFLQSCRSSYSIATQMHLRPSIVFDSSVRFLWLKTFFEKKIFLWDIENGYDFYSMAINR